MPGHRPLERLLAALVGAILGLIGASVFVAMGLWHIGLMVLPIGGAATGYLGGDRGIRALARVIGSL